MGQLEVVQHFMGQVGNQAAMLAFIRATESGMKSAQMKLLASAWEKHKGLWGKAPGKRTSAS